MSSLAGSGDRGHIPDKFFDFLVNIMKGNSGKMRFKDLKNAIKKNAAELSESPLEAATFIFKPELVIFSAYAQGMIDAKLKDPYNLNLVKERTVFTLKQEA